MTQPGSPITSACWVAVTYYELTDDGPVQVDASRHLVVTYGSGDVGVLVQWHVPDPLPWHDEQHAPARRRASASLS